MALYELYESECVEASRGTADEPKPHALIGIGYGNQYYTTFDPTYHGKIWLNTTYEVENEFGDSLGKLTAYAIDKFVAMQQDYKWDIITKRRMPVLRPGDFIKFHPYHEDPIELPACEIERTHDAETSIQLGAKAPDFVDSYEISTDKKIGMSIGMFKKSHEPIQDTSSEFFINDPVHYTAPDGSLVFDVPSNIKDADLKPRITLDLSIDLKTEKLLTVGACAVEMKTGGVYRRGGNFINWYPGQDIPEIDVTDWITAPAEYSPLFDDVSESTLTLGTWPTDGNKLIIEVSEVSGHTDCEGHLTINGTDESITINGAETYRSSVELTEKPTIVTYDIDCHLKVYATIKNTISIGVHMAENYEESHLNYKGHPKLTANGTLNFWKRAT